MERGRREEGTTEVVRGSEGREGGREGEGEREGEEGLR